MTAAEAAQAATPGPLIVVCGLGRLGQACVRTLLPFAPRLRCLDLSAPAWLAHETSPELAASLVIGDMRHPEALLRAGVAQARAVLLLSSDSGVNLEAALQVRLINGEARVVARSNGSLGLERSLRERWPALALVDPEQLTAGVFANALRADGSEATFTVEGEEFRIQRSVLPSDSADTLFALQGRQRRLVQWCPQPGSSEGAPASQWWDLAAHPRAGDQLYWLEASTSWRRGQTPEGSWWRVTGAQLRLALESLPETLRSLRQRLDARVLSGLALILLVLVLGSAQFGGGSSLRGLLLTIALLKGEYLDALGAMGGGSVMQAGSLRVATLSLVVALGGTLFTAWLVAVVLDWLLARRLGRREPLPLPAGSGVLLVIGGQRLAERLESLLLPGRFRVVRVLNEGQENRGRAFASPERALRVLRHTHCQGAAVLGDDLLRNLETALHLQSSCAPARLAVQSSSRSRSAELSRLFPGIDMINPLELAAEAVVATALGERVREVLRVNDTHLLLTDYQVEAGDTLEGRSLGQVAEGYGVLPVALIGGPQAAMVALPEPDRVLKAGSNLLVLAALEGLRAVEAGRMAPPRWRVELRGMGVASDRFEAQMLLARHLNRPPREVAALLDGPEGTRQTPPLHQGQGFELHAALRRMGIDCALVPC